MAAQRGGWVRSLTAWTRRWGLWLGVACAAMGLVLVGVAAAAQRHAPAPTRESAGRIVAGPAPAATVTTPSPAVVGLPRSAPIRLTVPALGIDNSPLQRLGLNTDGTVAVPTSFQQAGWFTGSVTPGQLGPMIILGHVDSYRGPGIFFRLGALRPGDTLSVTRADGRTVSYRITGVREYPKDDFPTAAVYANTPVPTIRLITCGGSFDTATRHYLSNVVAFGEQVATR